MESLIDRVSRHDPKCTEVKIPYSRNHSGTNNDITQDVPIRLVEALERNPFVRKIDFSYARRTSELFRDFAVLLRVNTVIQCIRLPFETSNEELIAIEESLCNNATVTTLALFRCNIRGRQGGEIIRRVLLSNGTIEEICLVRNVNLGADGAVGLARALRNERCALKKLNLYGCRMGNDGARELSNAVANNNVLEKLRIGRNAITFTGLCHIVEMLTTNSVLQVLVLAFNQDQRGHETAGDLLERALQHNASLRELDLNSCYLSPADLSSVFQTLARDNQTLVRLSIANNEMNEASAKNFASCLPVWKGLRDIYFWWYNGVSDAVLRGLLDGLMDNKSLVRVRATNVAALQGEGSVALWQTWSTFVTRRNKMYQLLEGNGEASGGGCRAVGPGLWPYLLEWCDNSSFRFSRSQFTDVKTMAQASAQAEASLIYHVLRQRSSDICESVVPTGKRPALEA